MSRAQQGFTLIEILVVVLILSILAGIVGINVFRHPGEAKAKAAVIQIKTFKSALQLYRMDQDRLPTQEQGLSALCAKPTQPPVPERYPEEGYLDSRSVPKDPWGRDYLYLSPGQHGEIDIYTLGLDGQPGGDGENADIGNWSE